MKRLLSFLLLFGAGFALLWFLQDRGEEQDPSDPLVEVPDEAGDEAPRDLIDVPDAPGEPDGGTSQVGLGSRLSYTRYDEATGEALFVLTAEDSRTAQAGWLDIEGVTLSYPGLGDVTAARGRLAVDANGRLVTGDEADATGGRIELEEAVVELREGHRLAPATIVAPRFEARYDEREVTLLGRPTWTSPELTVTGERIDLDLDAERIDAQGDTLARWLAADGTPSLELFGARLVVDGATALEVGAVLTGEPGAPARLEMAPRDPLEERLVLSAPGIVLESARASEDAPFVPTEVRIEGGRGELASGPARLSGETFGFDFEGDTRPERVRVRGDARLVLPPALWGGLDPDAELDPEVWGALVLVADDELELGRTTDAARVDVTARGVSTLTLGGLVMRAGDGFQGAYDRTAGELQLEGRGGLTIDGALPAADDGSTVRIEHRSDVLLIDYAVTEGAETLALNTDGPAVFVAERLPADSDADPEAEAQALEALRLDATNGLALRLLREDDAVSWRLDRAGGVTFTAFDEHESLSGTATELFELDSAARSLRGRGLSATGTDAKNATFGYAAQDVDVRGPEAVELRGAARFEGAGFELRGDTLTRNGSQLAATGGVFGTFQGDDQSATLRSARLDVEGFVVRDDGLRLDVVTASGGVNGSGSIDQMTFDVTAETVELFDWGQTERPQRLVVTGRTAFDLREGGRLWEIEADEVRAKSLAEELELVATGDLVVREDSAGFEGRGERLTLWRGATRAAFEAVLESGAEPARVRGLLPASSGPIGGGPQPLPGIDMPELPVFDGTVERVTLSPERVELVGLDGVVRGLTLPINPSLTEVRIQAGSLTSETEEWVGGLRDVLELDGEVVIRHTPQLGPDHVFRSEHVTFVRARPFDSDPEALPTAADTSFIAHGEVSLTQGLRFEAFGDHLEVTAPDQVLTFEGTPASILYAGLTATGKQLRIDPATMQVTSGPGTVTIDPELLEGLGPNAQLAGDVPWVLDHQGLSGRSEGDLVLEVLQKPRLTVGDQLLTASVGLFWLDRATLESRRQEARDDVVVPRVKDMVDELPMDPAANILRELYFEGPIEYTVAGDTVGSAEAMYLDLREQRGWLANAELFLVRTMRDREVRWSARAEWMQRTSEGTLLSNDAVLSPCSFVDQHLFISTENLIVRRAKDEDPNSFRVGLQGNALDLYGLLSIPLPPIGWDADDEGMPLVPELKLGSSARFGTFLATGISFDAEGLGDGAHALLGADEGDRTTSDGSVGLSWLGSRGVLLDLGLRLEAVGRYWFEAAAGGLVDDSRDRGLLRVDQDDRSDLRTWLRARGRYSFDENTWLDVVFSSETDPGVQAEFYEDAFLHYEERENYLNWRTSEGQRFFSARVKLQIDSARTQVEELPELRALIDRTPFQPFGDRTLLYSSDSTLGWYRRIAGDPNYQSPFALQVPFTDGSGDTHVLRGDTTHRVELPLTLPSAWKLVPFLETRATVWDRSLTMDDDPTRFDLEAGARLTTVYWRRFGDTTAQLAPFLESRASLVHEESGGDPYVLDAVDLPTGDDRHALGVRGRLFGWRDDEELDVELLARRTNLEGGDELDTFEVFAGWQTHLGDMPVGMAHDGRYDLDAGASVVSRSVLGLRPTEDLGLELSHSRALDDAGLPYYEAGTIRGTYRWTQKWEFEASQTLSVLDDTDLVYETILRRYGHDLVFELGVSRVAGEGGTSFTLGVRPEILFRRSPVGYANHR